MKLKLLISICISICSIAIFAQNQNCNCCIQGIILDTDTNEAIPFATVYIENFEKYTQSNEKGEFLLSDVCPERYTLNISILGYSNLVIEEEYQKNVMSSYYMIAEISDLDNVTVKAEKAKEKGTETISQERLTREEIISNPTQSLAASLSRIEGVTFASLGSNVEIPIIHGLYGNRVLVLNNGLKHAFQNWGYDHAPEIDIYSANNISVIKGAAGVRFGPEALSGAILVEPNPLTLNKPLYGNVSTGYQTNGRGYNANAEIGMGTEKWSYFANGTYTRIGDRNAPNYNLTNTGKEEYAFSLGARFNHKAWDFKVYYSFIDQNLAQLRSSVVASPNLFINSINNDEPIIINPFSYDINQPNQIIQHQLLKGEINWEYADDAQINFIAGVQLNERDEFDVRRNRDLPIIDLDLVTFDYQLEWEHPKWKGLDGFVGVQYFNQNNDNNPGTLTTPFIPNYNTDRLSAFVIEKVKFGDNTLEAGVRFDVETNDVRGREPNQDIFRDNYTFTNFTTSLGYAWKLSENSTFKSNLGSAFRTPNVAELFSFGQQGSRLVYGLLRYRDNNGQFTTNDVVPLDQSDVDLERGYKFTNEFRTSYNGNTHVLTGYANYIENFVFERPITISTTVRGPLLAFIIDQAEALFFGVDYTWKKEISEDFTSTFGLSYLWSRNIGKDEPLINQSPITTNIELQWSQGEFWIFDDSSWSLRPSYTFEQFQAPRTIPLEDIIDGTVEVTPESEIFDFLDPPEGYLLVDLSWNFKLQNFGGSITAQNLLNTSYRNYLNELRYFADEPGINILFGLNYNF